MRQRGQRPSRSSMNSGRPRRLGRYFRSSNAPARATNADISQPEDRRHRHRDGRRRNSAIPMVGTGLRSRSNHRQRAWSSSRRTERGQPVRGGSASFIPACRAPPCTTTATVRPRPRRPPPPRPVAVRDIASTAPQSADQRARARRSAPEPRARRPRPRSPTVAGSARRWPISMPRRARSRTTSRARSRDRRATSGCRRVRSPTVLRPRSRQTCPRGVNATHASTRIVAVSATAREYRNDFSARRHCWSARTPVS